MNRRDFLSRGLAMGLCPGMLLSMASSEASGATAGPQVTKELDEATRNALAEKEFVHNWLTDLMEGIHEELAPATQRRVMAAAGRGCYDRHPWKQEIVRDAGSRVDGLIVAMSKYFEVWREGDYLHVRYGEKNDSCYCPAARNRAPLPNDPHCECTRAMHQKLIEEALHKPVRVEIVSSVRRGGPTCHFMVDLRG